MEKRGPDGDDAGTNKQSNKSSSSDRPPRGGVASEGSALGGSVGRDHEPPAVRGKKRARAALGTLVAFAGICATLALALAWEPLTRALEGPSPETALRARRASRAPRNAPPLYHVDVVRFESQRAGGDREMFGPGFSGLLREALLSDAWEFDACRARFTEGTSRTRLHVKVEVERARLRVVGMPFGPEENPAHASCLRNSLESLRLPFLATMERASESDYVLAIDVLPSVSNGSPVDVPGSETR